MKSKFISCLVALTALCMGLQAQTFSVAEDVEMLSKGETVSFKIHVAGVTAMTSTHFELNLPSAFTVVSVDPGDDWKSMYSHEGGVVGGISTSDNALSGEGDIATVKLEVAAGTAVGTYPVTITNIRVNGVTLESTGRFNIVVVRAHTVTLDENATTAPVAATGVNAHVLRTINAGEWSTLCLPFAMSEAQVKAAFGSEVQLGDFTAWSSEENDDGAIVSINVQFTKVEAIEANHPYIIKVSQPVSEFTVENVDINPSESPTLQVGKRATERGYMYGTYVVKTIPEENIFLSENKFWYSTGTTQTAGYRGYFAFRDVLDAYYDETSTSARIGLTFADGTTTGINAAGAGEAGADGCYDLQGRRVSSGPLSNSQMKRGLYIQDGKKKVVK